jgi:hypothetical protein
MMYWLQIYAALAVGVVLGFALCALLVVGREGDK